MPVGFVTMRGLRCAILLTMFATAVLSLHVCSSLYRWTGWHISLFRQLAYFLSEFGYGLLLLRILQSSLALIRREIVAYFSISDRTEFTGGDVLTIRFADYLLLSSCVYLVIVFHIPSSFPVTRCFLYLNLYLVLYSDCLYLLFLAKALNQLEQAFMTLDHAYSTLLENLDASGLWEGENASL